MSDDSKNEPVQSDFDDWLAEEGAAAVDPVASAAPAAQGDAPVGQPDVAESVDDSGPAPDDEPTPQVEATDPSPSVDTEASDGDAEFAPDETAEIAIDTPDDETVGDSFSDDLDAVTEIPAIDMPTVAEVPGEPVVEFSAFDGGHVDITGEIEIVSSEVVEDVPAETLREAEDATNVDSEPIGDGSAEPLVPPPPPEPPFDFSATDPTQPDPFEDTGEAVFVTGETAAITPIGASAAASASFNDVWGVDEFDTDEDEDITPPPSVFDDDADEFTLARDQIRYGVTRDHADLAEAIAAAESEDTAPVALSAAIPGLEASVVGFDDVVKAEGHRRVRARASGDLVARVVTALALVGALVASLFWRPALVVFATSVFVLGAGEFYTALVRKNRKPIALFGFIGIVAASLGAFLWNAAAIPVAFLVATVLLLLYYAITPGKPDPMGNLALTMTVMVWAGLGSFAMLIVRSDDYRVLIAGVVVVVAAADIAAFFVGRSMGRTRFAPWVSPNKTVEGLVAGVIVAFGLGAVLHFFPPFELTSGLAIGAAAAVLTPLGDLAMSAAKRSLGLKDMGSVLPGHGGFLDRIDGLLFTIPAAWAIFIWAGIL